MGLNNIFKVYDIFKAAAQEMSLFYNGQETENGSGKSRYRPGLPVGSMAHGASRDVPVDQSKGIYIF